MNEDQVLSILLIDDNPDDRFLVAREIAKVLPRAHIDEVGEAQVLERALASGAQWQVVVTDYQLQWSTGLDVFRRLQRERPDVPVIMFTDSGSEEIAVAALKEGMEDYITKSPRHYGRVPYAIQAAAERRGRRAQAVRDAQALERSEGLLKLALEAAGMDTWELDGTTGQVHLHGRSPALFGRVPRALSLDDLDRLVAGEQQGLRHQLLGAVASGEPFCAEFKVEVAGAARWLRAAGVRHQPSRLVGVLEDVTERRQLLDELREADERKNQFIATLGHELRNPLAPIRYASHILGRSSDPGVLRAAAVIERQVLHMGALLDQLLDLSRITHGQIELRQEPVDLVQLAREAIDDIAPWAQERSQVLRGELPPAAVLVIGDRTRLKQVLDNLLNNAVKFTPQGGQVTVQLGVREDEVRVRVKDTGVGIRADMLGRVFDPLVQLHGGPDSALRGGLGIGLALVRTLVNLHGGTVRASSAGEQQGTTVECMFPLARREPEVQPPQQAAAGQSHGGRALVADDHPDSAAVLAELLAVEGYEVRTATDGLQAQALAGQWRPDVMVLDVGMPGLPGHGVARWVREQPWGAQVRLVAVTGWSRQSDRGLVMAAGFDAHLVKPVAAEALLAAVARRRDS
ncbi:MAG TPA: response regulator [Ramlibacter sp.]|nr:response regulator [Ramlibacter sp.]